MESSDESESEADSFAFETASYYDEELEEYPANDAAVQPSDGDYSSIGNAAISADISKRISNEDPLGVRGVRNLARFGLRDLEPIVTDTEQSFGTGIDNRKKLEPMRPSTKRGSNVVRPPSRKPLTETAKPGYSDNWVYSEQQEIKDEPQLVDLFNYIHEYKAYKVRCPIHLYGPRIPYIPAVVAVYTPVEVARPDRRDLKLGVDVLNEASIRQSDPTVLRLKYEATTKSEPQRIISKTVPPDTANGPIIDDWIRQMRAVDSLRPPRRFAYKSPTPELEDLLEPWRDGPLRRLIEEKGLRVDPELDCDLSSYIDLVCCVLGIPVYEDKIQALHLLFVEYVVLKEQRM